MTHKIAPALVHLAVPVGDLWTMDDNPRRGDLPAVKRSLDRFGQRFPILYREEHDVDSGVRRKRVYAGNHRLMAARELGWDMIAAVDASDMSHAEIKAFSLADNRTSELGDYDNELLSALLEEVRGQDIELLAATGYDNDALSELLEGWSADDGYGAGSAGSGDADADDDTDEEGDQAPTPRDLYGIVDVSMGEPVHQVAKKQVWSVGRHILVISDIALSWRLWAPLLEADDQVFVPFPSPFVPLFAKPQHRLVLVQPDLYLAGHLLDKWDSIHADNVAFLIR